MRHIVVFLTAILTLAPLSAQRHRLAEVNTETEEGKILQAIGQEADPTRKLQFIEQFTQKFPKHEATGWVLTQAQPLYLKASDFDKVLRAGEILIALDPNDHDAGYASLKAAEGKKDADAVLKWSALTSDAARKNALAPKSEDQSDEDYKHAVDYARQVATYTEYALYATALVEPDAQKVVRLVEAIEQRNPESQYITQAMSRYAWAVRAANLLPQGVAYGERAFARRQFNEDLLLAMADFHLNQPAGKQNLDKVVAYSMQIVELLASKPKPEGISDADWDTKKNTTLGLAHWMAGTALSTQGKFAPADKNLRVALPLVKNNDQLLAGALFHLGLSNYQMGKGRNAQQMKEALTFFQQCAALKSPFQAPAQKNLAVMRKETAAAK